MTADPDLDRPRILVTLPVSLRDELFSDDARRRLEGLGTVEWNERDGQFTAKELRERLADADVCVTGWGTPTIDAGVLPDADRPSLVAHVGGSVAAIASDALYDRGVSVCSANEVMAPFVAEGALAYALAALRDLPARDADIRAGGWPNDRDRDQTLFGRRVGSSASEASAGNCSRCSPRSTSTSASTIRT